MFGGCDEVDAEALKVVIGIGKSGNLGFASVARSGIYLADIQGAAEQLANLYRYSFRRLGIVIEFFAGIQIPAADKGGASDSALCKPGRNAQRTTTCLNATAATGAVAVVQDQVAAIFVSLESQSRSWTGVNGAPRGLEVELRRIHFGHAAAGAVAQQLLDRYERLFPC